MQRIEGMQPCNELNACNHEGNELSYVALYDTKYLKRVLKIPGLDKKTKDLIKQALKKA